MASILGTSLNDTLTGGLEADVIDGGAGNDSVRAGAGNDTVSGGAGSDTLLGEEGNDVLYGGADNDFLNGGAGNDQLYGEDGNDGFYGGGGNDAIYGGAGNDNLFGDGGNDVLAGGDGSDKVNGGTGNDTLDGGAGADIINGDAGNDTIIVRAGDFGDTINGGAGIDRIELELSSVDVSNALCAEFVAYKAWVAELLAGAGGDINVLASATSGATFTFACLGITLGTFEDLTVSVDGVPATVESLANTAPEVQSAVAASTDENVALAGAVAAVDADGDVLAWSVITGPAHGSLTLDPSTGHYTYTPAADYSGADRFLVRVSDDQGRFAEQTVDITVAPGNVGPVTDASTTLAAVEDTAASGVASATDADGDELFWNVESGPQHGTVEINAATGAYVYRAAANYSGADSFQLRVSDGSGASALQLVSVAVAAAADAPSLTLADARGSAVLSLVGGAGNDTITGTANSEAIAGGAGDDVLRGDGGSAEYTVALSVAAALTDVDGSETLSVRISGVPSSATLSAGVKNADGSWSLLAAQLAGLYLTTTSSADFSLTIEATAAEATGASVSVSDTLAVTFDRGSGGDTIDGGAGNDTIYGGAGDNTLIDGAGNDRMYGQAGNDTMISGSGNDTLDGGAGFDILDMSGATNAVTVNLATGKASGLGNDSVLNFEGVNGTGYNDNLTGSNLASWIAGGAGNDKIYGNSGNDTLDGGAGNDTIDGGAGNDTLRDGLGNDSLTGGSGDDRFIAGSGFNRYSGGWGSDTVDYSAATQAIVVDAKRGTVVGWDNDTVSSIETFIGSAFDDTFYGGSSANTFIGGAGNDVFRGLGGSDVFTGGVGNDMFVWLSSDVVSGRRYLGGDHILDFTSGDVLDLRDFTKYLGGAAVDTVVKVTDTGAGTIIAVKVGSTFYDLTTLDGVHSVTVTSLLADGAILV